MQSLNQDPQVRRFFPGLLSPEQSDQFLHRLIAHQEAHGFSFWAVETKAGQRLIGMIGLAHVASIETPFTPAVEIGWRLHPTAWGQGFATEGAQACLAWARDHEDLTDIISYTALVNQPSARVMQRIGMNYDGLFAHPRIPRGHHLRMHVLYRITL